MQETIYWLSTEGGDADEACGYKFNDPGWNNSITKTFDGFAVRACLEF